MRRYPESTRSAILWGVVPPNFRRSLYYARDGQKALDRLMEDCLADPICRAAFPDTREELSQVMARLATHPVPVLIRNPVNGEMLDTQITRAGLAQSIWIALTRPDRARRLPLAIHAAARGDFKPFIALDVAKEPPRRRYYNAMHLSVVCPEETSSIDRSEIAEAYRGHFMPADRAYEYMEACRTWKLPPVPRSHMRPVKAANPTLILSGYMDPITPPEWGYEVHRTLPRSRHIVVRQLSHEADGLGGADCLDRLFADFVESADADRLDTACLSKVAAPPFATGHGEQALSR